MVYNSLTLSNGIYAVMLTGLCVWAPAFLFAKQADTNRVHVLQQIVVEDKAVHNFEKLHKVDGMKVTVGKKTEVIHLEHLTVNKSSNNSRQIYAKVAGLNIFENDGSGLQLSIGGRGLDPNRTSNFNVRQNGYDISADPLGYPESYYTPPAEALERIEIIKGAASLQFGTQFGGLLNFRMKPPGGERPIAIELKQSVGSYGFLNSYNSVHGTQGSVRYFAYAHYKRGNGWRPNSSFHSFNAYADVHFQLNESHFIGVEYTHLNYLAQQPGGLDDKMFVANARQSNRYRNWFKVNWDLICLEWESRLSDNTRLETKISGLIASRNAIGYRGNRPSQVDNGSSPRDLLKGAFQNIIMESRLLHHYKVRHKRQSLLLGLRAYRGYSESRQGDVVNGTGPDFTFTAQEDVLSNYSFPNENFAFFAENIFRITPKWSLMPGLRLEFIQTRGSGFYKEVIRDLRDSVISESINSEQRSLPRTFLIGGIGSSFQIQPELEFYGNIAQNYRSVTFSDIQIKYASFEIDPEITDEKGWSADLGLRGRSFQYLRFDLSAFYLRYGNRIGEYFYEKDNGRVIRKRGNIGQAQVYGFESYLEIDLIKLFQIKCSTFRWNIYSNLALTQAMYTSSPLANVQGRRVEYVPLVNWKAGVEASIQRFKGTVQFSYLSEQYTDATNAVDGGYSGVNGRLPAYSLVDISLGWYGKHFSLEGSVNNVLNVMYATRRATGYPGPGIIPGDGRGFFLTVGFRM